jgi:hypothetical protein
MANCQVYAMTLKLMPLLLMALVMACTSVDSEARKAENSIKAALYKRGDGGEIIACRRVSNTDICISQEFPTPIFFDCSNALFDCVASPADVLAVPKVGISVGQHFFFFGASFSVERCFGEGKSCSLAMISSVCSDPVQCKCRSSLPGRRTIFYFSGIYGVTAFYSVGDIPPGSGIDPKWISDAIPLMTYSLVADKGFLRAPLVLERAARGPCPK